MADDLTPPAVRAPEAAQPAPLAQLEEPSPDLRRPAGSTAFPGRFAFAYAILAIVIGAGIGGFVVLSDRPADSSNARWSSWKPDAVGTESARQIAEHVGQRYRLETGSQLVGVIASEPEIQDVPVRHVALARGSNREDVSIIPAEDSIAYQLCGLGQRCAIPNGEPSVARGRLLHREALELALYTFKYVDGIDSVMAFMPPRTGQQPSFALFFRKDDLDPALKRPLGTTLSQGTQLTPKDVDAKESRRIAALTGNHLFQYSYQQAPDGSAVLVLQPPPL